MRFDMARKRALFGDVSKIRILLVAGLRMLAACVLRKWHVEVFGRYIFGDFADNNVPCRRRTSWIFSLLTCGFLHLEVLDDTGQNTRGLSDSR